MLPEGVLSIGIRADFWQPQKNDRKAELIKYWHQRAVLDRMNIQISKELYTTMSRPFYSDAKKAKKCPSSSSSPSHFLFPHDFSGTIAGTNIINTPPARWQLRTYFFNHYDVLF